jgi:CHASE3 domain sensor protein
MLLSDKEAQCRGLRLARVLDPRKTGQFAAISQLLSDPRRRPLAAAVHVFAREITSKSVQNSPESHSFRRSQNSKENRSAIL